MGAVGNAAWLTGAAVFASATGTSRELVDDDAAIRRPVVHCRRIGFVQLVHGTGCSTTTAGTGALLASRRVGRVAVADASGGPNPAPRIAGVPPRRPGLDWPTSASGLYGLDLAGSGRPLAVDGWHAAVDPVARFFDVVATDWGVRHPSTDLRAVIAASHVVCLVLPADPAPVRVAAELLHVVVASGCPVPIVAALVGTSPSAGRAPRGTLRGLPVPSVVVRYERSGGDTASTTGHRGRLARLRLAAALMRAATPEPSGRDSRPAAVAPVQRGGEGR